MTIGVALNVEIFLRFLPQCFWNKMNNAVYLKGLLGVMGCCGLAALFSVVVLCGVKETGTFRNKKKGVYKHMRE